MMDDHRGWMGSASELLHTLRCCGCDMTSNGAFCVSGSITSYLGAGEEFIVGADAVYYVNGERRHLLTMLAATSYGRIVTVI